MEVSVSLFLIVYLIYLGIFRELRCCLIAFPRTTPGSEAGRAAFFFLAAPVLKLSALEILLEAADEEGFFFSIFFPDFFLRRSCLPDLVADFYFSLLR